MADIQPDTEYQEICENLRTSVSFFWKGFAVFITINGLLLAGIAFIYGDFSGSETYRGLFGLILGVFGLMTSILAMFAVKRLLDFARIFLNRGMELENSNSQKLLHKSDKVFWNSKNITAKTLSFIVFIYFGLIWFAVLGFCIFKLITT